MSKKNIWIAAVVIVIAALGFMGYRQIAAKKASAERRDRDRRRPARRPFRDGGSRRQFDLAD